MTVGPARQIYVASFALLAGACASAGVAGRAVEDAPASTCPPATGDVDMKVVYAPGRVMAIWALPRVSPEAFTQLHATVAALSERTSQEIFEQHPDVALHKLEQPSVVGFTVSDCDPDVLDEVRETLDEAARRFEAGSCEDLIGTSSSPLDTAKR